MSEIQQLSSPQATPIRYLTSDQQRELNAKLNLNMPHNVLTEHLPTWVAFFRLVRWMWISDLVTEPEVPSYLSDFNKIPDANKQNYLNALTKLIEQQREQKEKLEELFKIKEAEDFYKDTIAMMPENIREQFINYMDGGEEEDLTEITQQLNDTGDVEVLNRLQNALDKRNLINASSTRKATINQAMSPDQIDSRFNLGSSLPEQQNLPPQNSNPQRLKPILPKLPIRNQETNTIASDSSTLFIPNIPKQSTPGIKHTRGLDDLLNK